MVRRSNGVLTRSNVDSDFPQPQQASQLPKISHVLELILCEAIPRSSRRKRIAVPYGRVGLTTAEINVTDASHLPRSVDFYRSTLRLGEPFLSNDRIAGFSLGNGTTLLLFQRGSTTKDLPMRAPDAPSPFKTPAIIPAHGLSDKDDQVRLKTHFALAVDKPEDVDAWERELGEKGVPLLGNVQWPGGGRSVYFSDPDEHVGELASHGIWPHY